VIAKALPNDDAIAECEDEVAVVHLTWTQKQERPPWPLTTFIASADEFESHVASEYDWEPRRTLIGIMRSSRCTGRACAGSVQRRMMPYSGA
jgi:hypothetical protein